MVLAGAWSITKWPTFGSTSMTNERHHELRRAVGGIRPHRRVDIAPDIEGRHSNRADVRREPPCSSDTRPAPPPAPQDCRGPKDGLRAPPMARPARTAHRAGAERCRPAAACRYRLRGRRDDGANGASGRHPPSGGATKRGRVRSRQDGERSQPLRMLTRNAHETCPPQSWPTRWKRLLS